MKLSEALEVLLKAEDKALEIRTAAEQEAKAIIQKAHDKFAQDQESRLNAAREEARAQVESTKHSVEMDALHIAELAQKARDRMREHFGKSGPALTAKIAGDLAARYAAQGFHSGIDPAAPHRNTPYQERT
jgi:vacuolar-type H+-ATPase subunit H